MRFQPSPADFHVEEVVHLPLTRAGPYSVYRVQKRGITTLQAQEGLAAALGLPGSAVSFPALKDSGARSVQYGTVRGHGLKAVDGRGFRAERVGASARPIVAQDLLGNRFRAVLRELSAHEVASTARRLSHLETYGFPNYFDQQRFGSYAPGHDWVGKLILRRDSEGALRAHLTEAFVGDPPRVLEFKLEARQHWGEWRHLLQIAPRPSNMRSVLTFLVDHPQEYRKALNLITPRVLSLYLSAHQSLLWNRLAARYLQAVLGEQAGWPAYSLTVAGEDLPAYDWLSDRLLEQLRCVSLPLFQQRMELTDPAAAHLGEAVLSEEGLRCEDLKARVLTKAYLGRGARPLLSFPAEVLCEPAVADETAAHRQKMTIRFVLRRGSYATLMLKLLVGPPDMPPEPKDEERPPGGAVDSELRR